MFIIPPTQFQKHQSIHKKTLKLLEKKNKKQKTKNQTWEYISVAGQRIFSYMKQIVKHK